MSVSVVGVDRARRVDGCCSPRPTHLSTRTLPAVGLAAPLPFKPTCVHVHAASTSAGGGAPGAVVDGSSLGQRCCLSERGFPVFPPCSLLERLLEWLLCLRAVAARKTKNAVAAAACALPWQCHLMKPSMAEAFNAAHHGVPRELHTLVAMLASDDIIADSCLETLAVRKLTRLHTRR